MHETNNTLNRQLGLVSLITYYFSTIVGVGIFVVPLIVAKMAGPASIISWIIVLICAYPFATIFAYISQKYQVSGSIQKFLEESWGLKFGRSIALFLVLSALFGNALLSIAASKYFNEIFKCDYNLYLLSLFFLIIPIFFNLLQIGLSSKIQTFTLIVLVILLEAIVISAIPHHDFAKLTPFAPNGYNMILPTVSICFYSIVGWENVDAIAEEVKDPGKNFKTAAKIAIMLISFFYLSVALTIVFTLDYKSLANATTILSAILSITMGVTASKFGGLVAMVLLILGANAWILGTSRVIFALARDNILPKKLALISNNIPRNAVIMQIIPYSLIALTFALLNVSEDLVVEITSLNYLMLYALIFFSGVKYFASKNYRILSCCAMIVTLIFIFQSNYKALYISLLLLMMCITYVYKFRSKQV